jgi:hypothetical protein
MYQMVIKYPKCLSNIPNGHKIYHQFAIKGPPKCSQIEIFGLKINHLATLLRRKKIQGNLKPKSLGKKYSRGNSGTLVP